MKNKNFPENTSPPESKIRRSILNTSIKSDVLLSFRRYCQAINMPMNFVIEMFMEQFSKGHFVIRLNKNKIEMDMDEDELYGRYYDINAYERERLKQKGNKT